MKKNFLTFIFAICLIIPCTLLFSACGKQELIYFQTVMPSEYEIEIEYTSEKVNFESRFIKKGNEFCAQKDPTDTSLYIEYYTLTNRTEKPYDYYRYNYVYDEWSSVSKVNKSDTNRYGGADYPEFDTLSIFSTLKEIVDVKITPFEQSQYVEDCTVAGRPCVKYCITSSDGSTITYSYDKETSAILEHTFVDNDGDSLNQSYSQKVTKFSTTVANDWKNTFLESLPA